MGEGPEGGHVIPFSNVSTLSRGMGVEGTAGTGWGKESAMKELGVGSVGVGGVGKGCTRGANVGARLGGKVAGMPRGCQHGKGPRGNVLGKPEGRRTNTCIRLGMLT